MTLLVFWGFGSLVGRNQIPKIRYKLYKFRGRLFVGYLYINCCNLVCSFGLQLSDGLVQVLYQIVCIFDAYTDTDETVGETMFYSFLSRYRCMRHTGRMIDK